MKTPKQITLEEYLNQFTFVNYDEVVCCILDYFEEWYWPNARSDVCRAGLIADDYIKENNLIFNP